MDLSRYSCQKSTRAKQVPGVGALSIGAVLVTLMLQGCLSGALKPVAAKDRDTTGLFDGSWKGVVTSTAPRQQGIGNWTLNCSDLAGQEIGPLVVREGEVSLRYRNAPYSTFVNSNGGFRFELPSDTKFRSTGPSDIKATNSTTKIFVSGSLDTLNGNLTRAFVELGNTGCMSKVLYEKI